MRLYLDSKIASCKLFCVVQAAQVSSTMPERSVGSTVQAEPEIERSSSSTTTTSSDSPNLARNVDQSGSFFSNVFDPLQTIAKRAVIYLAFLAAKQPGRIKSVLKQVYCLEMCHV